MTAVVVTGIATAARPARARPRPHATRFVANKSFGLGLMIGAPTGLAGKYYLGDDTAFDFGVGEYYRYRYQDALELHADFLWHPAVLAVTDPFVLPLYLGIGGRFLEHDRYQNDYAQGTHLGVRAPLGLAMDFNRVPLDVFFELALVVDLVVHGADDGYVDLSGAIGARYYF